MLEWPLPNKNKWEGYDSCVRGSMPSYLRKCLRALRKRLDAKTYQRLELLAPALQLWRKMASRQRALEL